MIGAARIMTGEATNNNKQKAAKIATTYKKVYQKKRNFATPVHTLIKETLFLSGITFRARGNNIPKSTFIHFKYSK